MRYPFLLLQLLDFIKWGVFCYLVLFLVGDVVELYLHFRLMFVASDGIRRNYS